MIQNFEHDVRGVDIQITTTMALTQIAILKAATSKLYTLCSITLCRDSQMRSATIRSSDRSARCQRASFNYAIRDTLFLPLVHCVKTS